ncbi:bleomycin resistance family protein [Pedobacter sp. KBS0701]|nr:bleomycin resistance family protein [Pedobacter sp. KBS0701]
MLESHDMQATLKFYTEVLNFTCDVKLNDLSWLSLRKDEIEIMFCSPNEHRNIPKPIMSGSLYIKTNEVTALWESLKDHGKICYPLEDFDYGMREFAIYDNNGYLLQFGQNL